MYSRQCGRYRSRSVRRVSASRTATNRHAWRLPPLGAKRAFSSTRYSTSCETGSAVNSLVVGAQRIAS